MIPAALALALLASPAAAATITASDTALTAGRAIALDVADFTSFGPAGRGGSVVNDGRSVAMLDATTSRPYGRSAATPGGSWIDSQDLSHVRWAVDFDGERVTSMTFRVSDAHDQPASFFRMAVGDGRWETEGRQANAAFKWFTVAFDRAVTRATLVFRTTERASGDGYGLSDARYCPVPSR
jgi:hypothetical protein